MLRLNEKITALFKECKNYEDRHEKYKTTLKNVVSSSEELPIKTESVSVHTTKKHTSREEHVTNRQSDDSLEKLSRDLDALVRGTKIRTASVEFSSLSKMLALACFAAGDELTGIGHLIESHAVVLKQHIHHRYIKTEERQNILQQPHEFGLNPSHMTLDPKNSKGEASLKTKLAGMPEEWYIIQLTVQYEKPDVMNINASVADTVRPLHITVLPTGKNAIDPFCITLPKPKNDSYDGFKEIVEILKNNKAELEAYYGNNKAYWKMREKQNNKMKIAVTELEHSWLREWRILLMADMLEDLTLVKEMSCMIDKLIADDLSVISISPSSRWLLKKIATSACFLTKIEIARAVTHVIGDKKKLTRNVILSIHAKLSTMDSLRMAKRKSLILIVDENIDHISFESMAILRYHPVTRFPSFHIAYAMFKEHEATIVRGCKVIKLNDNVGTFIVNPARNLSKMESRLKLFINYWLPLWEGTYGVEPKEDSYEKVLVNHDVLMYAGHGSGIQYLPGEKIEKLRVRSTVLLFGCSSVKLYPMGGRFPPYGVSNQYLTACSPCVLGMLWEVTDGDIDRMTAGFMSTWIPSNADRPWSDIDINKWADGIFKFKNNTIAVSTNSDNEPEMLRAVGKSKQACTQHMTAAAIVVRGLPLRLE